MKTRPVGQAEKAPREGWGGAAARAHENQDDLLLDRATATRFDDTEWTWCEYGDEDLRVEAVSVADVLRSSSSLRTSRGRPTE